MAPLTRTAATRLRHTQPTAGPRAETQPPGLLVLDRYRLHRPLGAGGFGTVWMARDERLERDVAVKVLARDRIEGGRFEREARAAARLSHPGIVTLYEAAVDDDGAYLVSELVRGATLSQLLESGRLSDRDVVGIGIVLCDALAHAHTQGVVHRDVKPSNVLVPEQPGAAGHVAKLTDFGVARLIGADTLTRTGDVIGTAAYMAPEQADGREAGAAADLYSLALVLYEALTGVNPIVLTPPAQRARRLGAHLPPLRRQRRGLPGELGHGLDLALRPRPRERGTVEELRAELMASLDQVADRPGIVESAWPRRPSRSPSRSRNETEQWHLAPAGHLNHLAAGEHDGDAAGGHGAELTPNAASPLAWPGRALAGAGAAATAAWVVTLLPGAPAGSPAAVALAAALAVAALPRIGWLILTAGLATALAANGRPGPALVFAIAALLPLVLTPRRGTSWPLAAAAAGLGVIALAGAWPALAARAGSAWRRAALAAVGWIWTAAAGLLGGHALYTRLPAVLPSRWTTSLAQTAEHVLPRLFSPGMLAAAAVWGLAAAVLPSLTSSWLTSRRLSLQVVLVTAWSAGLASGVATALRVLHAGISATPGAIALGGVAAAVLALAPGLIAHRRRAFPSTDPQAGLA